MIVLDSRKQRRVLVRIERGEDPVRSLAELAKAEKIRAAWVRGIGSLEWALLDRHDPERGAPTPPERVDEASDVLSLEGHVAVEGGAVVVTLHAALARDGEVVGGRLVGASAHAIEMVIDVFEDVRLERVEDASTGLSVWAGPSRRGVAADALPGGASPGERPSRAWISAREGGVHEHVHEEEDGDRGADGGAPAGSGGVTWADVAAVSAAPEVAPPPKPRKRASASAPRPAHEPPALPSAGRANEPKAGSLYSPAKGDFVQHRQFGLCRVDREDGAGGITLRLPSGVRKKIKLEYMEVGAPRNEGGKTVYPIRPRRR